MHPEEPAPIRFDGLAYHPAVITKQHSVNVEVCHMKPSGWSVKVNREDRNRERAQHRSFAALR